MFLFYRTKLRMRWQHMIANDTNRVWIGFKHIQTVGETHENKLPMDIDLPCMNAPTEDRTSQAKSRFRSRSWIAVHRRCLVLFNAGCLRPRFVEKSPFFPTAASGQMNNIFLSLPTAIGPLPRPEGTRLCNKNLQVHLNISERCFST